ncbi:MAG: FKBP-type peptidyl-prolyl cis-trans isomerase [Bacteroidales bacterium]|nr:FKBP-type peptidyl-prolyl cis-trans isomerase [Bacteroidales bacterium]
MKKIELVVFMAVMLTISSCNNTQETTGIVNSITSAEPKEKYDPFIEGNQNILRMEDEDIQLFLKRYGWHPQKMASGLYVEILKEGEGDCFKEGDEVILNYETQLLDGEQVYNSQTDGIKQFKVDKSEEITALHEVVKQLKPGSVARLVIPSYLAYGVAGDGNKIKGRKSIAMTIEIIK